MVVTPEVGAFLDMLAAAGAGAPPPSQQSPPEVREAYRALYSLLPKEDVASVTDRTLPGPAGDLPVRVYHPVRGGTGDGDGDGDGHAPDVGGPGRGAGPPAAAAAAVAAGDGTGSAEPVSGLVWFHGGGWTVGDLDTADPVARCLANRAGVVVVSVDYRLGPEHPFPAAFEDALAAVRRVAAQGRELGIDPARLAVGGDSAGGNLAALACQHLRDSGPPIRFQLLHCPWTDAHLGFPSVEENAQGYMLTKDILLWFRDNYLGDGDRDDPRVSPLWAPDGMLVGLPPALVTTAEHDPLRDEGEAYANRLKAAGVEVTLTRYEGMIHNFMTLPTLIPQAETALQESAQALRHALEIQP